MSAPSCMWCGKALRKFTHTLYFVAPGSRLAMREGEIAAVVATQEEAQRHTNHQVVSAARGRDGTIRKIGTWDGTSFGLYGEGLFCTGGCAQSYGIRAAKEAKRTGV